MKIKHINNIFKLFRGFICDFYLYCKAVYSSKYQRQQLIRDMMLIGHSLEKGMFFKDKKQEWGQQKAVRLTRLIEKYYNCDYDKLKQANSDRYIACLLALDYDIGDFEETIEDWGVFEDRS